MVGIAISGKAGAGKTALAEAIDHQLMLQWTPSMVMHLAAPIYEEAVAQGMDKSKKDRPLLQRIGDDHTRVDPTYYPRLLVERWEAYNEQVQATPSLQPESVVAIVDDVRKVIEAEYLRQKGFYLVRLDVAPDVQRERIVGRDGRLQDAALSHWTETDLDHYDRWDIKIPNDGHLELPALAFLVLSLLGMDGVAGGLYATGEEL